MSNDKSDAAEQLLNYLAYGMTASEALGCFLVNDEEVPSEVVNTVGWMDPEMASRCWSPPRRPPTGDQFAEEHWRKVLENTKSNIISLNETDLAVLHALELEAVVDLLGEDQTGVSDHPDKSLSILFDGGE